MPCDNCSIRSTASVLRVTAPLALPMLGSVLLGSAFLTSAASAQCSVESTTSLTTAFRTYVNPVAGQAAPAGGTWSFWMGQPFATPLIGVQPAGFPFGITWYGRPEQQYNIPTVGAVYSPDSSLNQNNFYDRPPRFTGLMMHPGNASDQDSVSVFTAQLPVTITAMSAQAEVLGDISNGVLISMGDITGNVRHEGSATLVPYNTADPVIINAALSTPINLAPGESVFIRVNNAGIPYEDWANVDFTITLKGGPAIVAPPHASSACLNHPCEIRLLAAGSGPLQYQWRRNGQPLTVTDHYVAVTTDRLQITSLRPEDAASFDCIVTGPCGSLQSAPVAIAFCPANFNCDGATDFFDYLDFVDAFSTQNPAADFNADGTIDFFDYLDFVDAFSSGC